ENFAIKLSSNIILDPLKDQEGLYQLAILSDDGAVLEEMNADGSVTTLVNNDGTHPTRMGCGATIDMRWGQRRKIQFKYYQGPRYHISAILMWRPVLSSNVANDQACGSSGNDLFFDPNHNSAPKAGYTNLLARGWRPLGMGNYSVRSTSTPYNPCVKGVAPVISDFKVEELTSGSVIVTWKTDIDATSQVRIVNMATGRDELTNSDNILRKSHSVQVNALPMNVNLMLQGVSISSSYGKTLSAPISFQIQ
ncbi:MAG: hypothetical protein K2X47_09335, partial [Bdellovibrionales bacterium]|nr:hypothetical protein [Bdellovibrionales bacterium]